MLNDKQIVKDALNAAGISQAELSRRMGYANKGSLATMLSRPSDLRTSVLLRILDVLGFEVVVRPKNKKAKTEWVLFDDAAGEVEALPDVDAIRASMKPPVMDDIMPDTLKQITPEQAEQEGNVLLASCN